MFEDQKDPEMRNPWDSDDVKDPRDPDLADPFGGDIGPVKADKPKPRVPKRSTPVPPPRRTRRPKSG